MRSILLGLLALAGCTADQLAKAEAVVSVVCQLDGKYVPLADSIAGLVPLAAPYVSVDQVLAHPAVVAMCDGLLAGSKPVAAVQGA